MATNTAKVIVHTPKLDKEKFTSYKNEVEFWQDAVGVDLKKQASILLLALPNEEGDNVRDQVLEHFEPKYLKKDDGVDILLTFLEKKYGKDEMMSGLDKYKEFRELCRKDESITEYISNFETKYNRISKIGAVLPPLVLCFELIRNANITEQEEKLVLTAIDFEKKDDLFNMAKISLRRFLGDGCSGSSGSGGGGGAAVKQEALWTGNGNRGSYGRGNSDYRGSNGRGNSDYRGQRGNSGYRGQHGNSGYRGQRGRGQQNRGRGILVDKSGDRPLNPEGDNGKPRTCFACGSYRHYASVCPYNTGKSENKKENVRFADGVGDSSYEDKSDCHRSVEEEAFVTDIVLYTGYNRSKIRELGVEAHNCAVLDCACTSTVCGQNWFEAFRDSLSDVDSAKIEENPGTKLFRFGGGTVLGSKGSFKIPVYVAGMNLYIVTDVVESDIPLLLSKSAMKKAKMVLDLEHDMVTILGRKVALNETSSGHYCVPITRDMLEQDVFVSIGLESMNSDDLKKALKKLHRQFGHPEMIRLIKLLKGANVWKEEFQEVLTKIHKHCWCKEYSRSPSRPVVSLPKADKFNDLVCMDLKEWKSPKKYILHLIDYHTRYTQSIFIDRKLATTVIDCIMIVWVSIFGVMKCLLSDNGGEFTADETREVASILNVELHTTGAESPWQNGLCERNHHVIDMILTKLQAEYPKSRMSVLLKWAILAKNSLAMWNGYSSHQLVFGQNPNLPNILQARIPALDDFTSSETFAEHLNALHSAREGFIQSEYCGRIKRALRHRIRASEQTFHHGDKVFYKRDGHEKWLGPAKVLMQDGKIVFVRHGSAIVRVSLNRIMLDTWTDGQGTTVDNSPDNSAQNIVPKPRVNNDACGSHEGAIDNSGEVDVSVELDNNEAGDEGGEAMGNVDDGHGNEVLNDDNQNVNDDHGNEVLNEDNQNRLVDTPVTRQSQRILNQQHGWEVYLVTLPSSRHKEPDCIMAKQVELDKLRSFDVFEEVPYVGQHCISTRWVLWMKGSEVRARLVARGFEEDPGTAVDSPTVSKSSVRFVLAMTVAHHWIIKSTDIKSAFLQGMSLKRNVYLVPPKEAGAGDKVWKLKRCLYGLSDAARQFYESVTEEMVTLGCMKSNLDPSMFYKRDENGLSGLLVSHIDDFLHSGTDSFENSTTAKLCKRFIAGSHSERSFSYVGYQLTQFSSCIVVDQNSYLDSIEVGTMAAERELQKDEPLSSEELTEFRSLVGSLNWVVQGTRPDLAFSLVELSTKFKNATVRDLVTVKKLVLKAKQSKTDVVFPDLGPESGWRVIGYCDASFANLSDGVGSCMGYVVFLVGHHNKACPIAWKSGKISRVVNSTEAAEALALSEVIGESILLKKLLVSVKGSNMKSMKVTILTDHKGVHEALSSTKMVKNKRLRIDIAEIKECISKGDITEVRRCTTKQQLADCLTKKGADGRKLLAVLQSGILPSV